MTKLKTRKCALRSCRVEFTPKRYWQKFHTNKCAWTAKNKLNTALIRRAKKSIEAEEREAS